jgi:hypothetical protein
VLVLQGLLDGTQVAVQPGERFLYEYCPATIAENTVHRQIPVDWPSLVLFLLALIPSKTPLTLHRGSVTREFDLWRPTWHMIR